MTAPATTRSRRRSTQGGKQARHWLPTEPLCQVLRAAHALGVSNKTLSRRIALHLPHRPEVIERHIIRMLSGEVPTIEWRRADAYAIALGLHPFDIWAEAWEDWGPACYAVCVCCGKEFKKQVRIQKPSEVCRQCLYPHTSTRTATSSSQRTRGSPQRPQ